MSEIKCDLCDKKGGFQGFDLKTCRVCKVSVHDSCYGLNRKDDSLTNWICHACAFAEQTGNPRPTTCALCSVSDGVHAMHPLYDTYGKKGKRIAWVHTLCASFVGTNELTRGTVFACDRKGRFDGDEEFSDSSSSSDEEEVSSLHHYVISDPNNDDAWAYAIKEHRKLKCMYCGEKDNNKKSMRIPVQCSLGSQGELVEFKDRTNDTTCFLAMHVGCVKWMDPPKYPRVFFFPGDSKSNTKNVEPMCFCYCDAHARSIHLNAPGRKKRPVPTGNIKNVALTSPPPTKKKPTSKDNPHMTRSKKVAREFSDSSLVTSPVSPETKGMSASKLPPLPSLNDVPSSPSKKPERVPLSQEEQSKLSHEIAKDVLSRFKNCNDGTKEITITSEVKKHWLAKTNLIPSEFKEVWSKTKKIVENSITNPWEKLWMPDMNVKATSEWFKIPEPTAETV